MKSSTALDSPAKYQAAIDEFINNGAGPLTSTGVDVLGERALNWHGYYKQVD